MEEGIDPVLGIRGEIVCCFKGYLKEGLLVTGEALVGYFCSVRKGGYVLHFVGYFQEAEGRMSRGGSWVL